MAPSQTCFLEDGLEKLLVVGRGVYSVKAFAWSVCMDAVTNCQASGSGMKVI